MKTIWNGESFLLEFETGLVLELNIEQTKEFEMWVMDRINKKEVLKWKQFLLNLIMPKLKE